MKFPLVVNFKPSLNAKGPTIMIPIDDWIVEGETDSEFTINFPQHSISFEGKQLMKEKGGECFVEVIKAGKNPITLFLVKCPSP